MLPENLKKALRFYYITDDSALGCTPVEQVEFAIQAGATMVQYRNKFFSSRYFNEVLTLRNLCKSNAVPFIVNDNIVLAKAVAADGVHLGQGDEGPEIARDILGSRAIVGVSVSNLEELKKTRLALCDYIGTGPVFATKTKKDAKEAIGLSGLKSVIQESSLPVVAIGGINETRAKSCFEYGASGIAVISCISRAKNPLQNALMLGSGCGLTSRKALVSPWNKEFDLIKKLLENAPSENTGGSFIKVQPGDDTCLFRPIKNPVVTTDTQKEDVHFCLDWQTPEEIGRKAVEVTFSDLAASYAAPLSLFVNLALPPCISEEMVESIYKGIKQGLLKHDAALGGGNISRGNQLSLDLFALGLGTEIFPTRSNALPGDSLYCTGPLGLARAGLDSLIRKDTTFTKLIERFKSPKARFDAAQILAENNITCVMDISDGLAGDAKHIAEAAGVTIEFALNPGYFDPDLVSYCDKYNLVAEEMFLSGGEDYELLFTCTPEKFETIKKQIPDALQVGRCLKFNGKHILNLPPGVSSFQHGQYKARRRS
jgi:thiamine-monophosphate kinase